MLTLVLYSSGSSIGESDGDKNEYKIAIQLRSGKAGYTGSTGWAIAYDERKPSCKSPKK